LCFDGRELQFDMVGSIGELLLKWTVGVRRGIPDRASYFGLSTSELIGTDGQF